jgi:uncharacterized protein (DUF2235 family)
MDADGGERKMKKLIVCCDGTWQKLSSPYPTNVVKIAIAANQRDKDGNFQVVYYDEGVGTELHNKFLGGMFGVGLDLNIIQAYRFLCLNYYEGDEIFLIGFSRGAYTVRSLAGFIYKCGLLKREHLRLTPEAFDLYRDRDAKTHPEKELARNFRAAHSQEVTITALCCWDAVGSLGIPDKIPVLSKFINKNYKFHDVKLSRIIKNAFHAVALDEHRKVFNWTPMHVSKQAQNLTLKQMLFVGDHGCIGGGDELKKPLSDIALEWMMDQVRPLGLSLDETKIPDKITRDPFAPFDNKIRGFFRLTGRINRKTEGGFDNLDPSAVVRMKLSKNYQPYLQEKFRTQLKAWEKVTYP